MTSIANIRARFAALKALSRDDRGLSTVEYVIVLVLIAAVAMGAWQAFGDMVKGKLEDASDGFDETVNFE